MTIGATMLPARTQVRSIPDSEVLMASADDPSDPTDVPLDPASVKRPPKRGIYAGMTLNDRYLIDRKLGQGGIGVVYQARDKRLFLRPVVIKVLLEKTGRDQWFEKKFQQEIESLARIDHPGVVGIFEAGEAPDKTPFIVMQFVKGMTLSKQIQAGGMDLRRAARILLQASRALTAAHDEGIIHCDLKPDNIMLQDLGEGEDQVKVLDFGIAKVKRSQVASAQDSTRVAGTLPYMAPEQLLGDPTSASDIYALGVIAYEMLTGRQPFEPATPYQLLDLQRAGVRIKPRQLRVELSEAVEAAILKALEFDPAQRYGRARDFGKELATALSPEITAQETPRIFLLYKPDAQTDAALAARIKLQLADNHFIVLSDEQPHPNVEWAAEVTRRARTADAVVAFLSAESIESEMLAFVVETAYEAAQRRFGRPRLLPLRVAFTAALPEHLAIMLNDQEGVLWQGADSEAGMIQAMLDLLRTPPKWEAYPAKPQAAHRILPFDPIYGAVPLDSPFYIERATDQELYAALDRRESIVLIKGARQMGKSSLLARGLHRAREAGARVVLTDFQKLNTQHLESIETLLLTLAGMIADELDLAMPPEETWSLHLGPSLNFDRYLKRVVLGKHATPLIWGVDEVDRLLTCDYASEVFGLFRSWHNARSLDPRGPWPNLTLAMAYKTEVHLFIPDINQSPFNVGTSLALEDFTFQQVADLNRRYGAPLTDGQQVERFLKLVGGHPYLVQQGLRELAANQPEFGVFERLADSDDGPFADHLKGILLLLKPDANLGKLLLDVFAGSSALDDKLFYKLRSAGIITGATAKAARPRCLLYERYLKRHLADS
jgi:serine/threonine protein kinase